MNRMVLRLPHVLELTGLSKSTIYARIKIGVFPKPINLGGNSRGWLDQEVRQTIGFMACGDDIQTLKSNVAKLVAQRRNTLIMDEVA
ncbi:helix-turn-helix transcriptional regulator [Alteromonas flava]|uniref:helix-turn-helix transcriptional regulator n=1 Tax=Alteromonas flava TaxID=2048003 RepID=UPI000C29148E|nr:AlpA family phage regulatory protein [Alteromonas flava]